MSNDIDPVEFGKALGTLAGHANDIKELKEGQAEANKKLDKLLEYQAKQRGAASVLMLLSSAVAAVVGWAVSWFTKG